MLWSAYDISDNRNPFGRWLLGFAGWHDDMDSAHAEAVRRYPNIDPSNIRVNRT